MVKEQQEAAEAEHAIAEMDRKKQSKMEHKAHLLAQIEATQEAIRKKRESDSPSSHLKQDINIQQFEPRSAKHYPSNLRAMPLNSPSGRTTWECALRVLA